MDKSSPAACDIISTMKAKIIAIVVSVFSAFCALARDVQVANIDYSGSTARSVTLSVSAGDAMMLYAAHGASDAGTDLDAWETVEPIREVPASEEATAVDVDLPEKPDACFRFFLCTVVAPFKKQLAFLKSDGTQYFTLGTYHPDQRCRIEADVRFDTYLTSQGYWGARKAAASNACLCLYDSGNGRFRFDFASDTSPKFGNATFGYNRCKIVVSQREGVVLGGVGKQADVNQSAFTAPCPLMLFAFNNNGTATLPSKMTVWGFKVWTNGVEEASSLIYDLVPCVTDDDTVTFYNRADKTFLPVTSGSFAYDEADVVPSTVGELTAVARTEVVKTIAPNREIVSSRVFRRDGKLKVELSVTEGHQACRVLAAYGAADAGEMLGNWDACASLGTVDAGSTSFVSELPFVWSDEIGYVRFFLCWMPEEPGPRCLRSTGAQYVVTDYTATGTIKIEAKLAFLDTASEAVVLWSGRTAANSNAFGLLLNQGDIRWDYGNTMARTGMFPAQGEKIRTVTQTGLRVTLDRNSTSCADLRNFTAGAPLTFFALNTAGAFSYLSTAMFAEVKVWSDLDDDDSLVLDLVPALKDGRCGFQNVLTGGRFYPNSAEGDDLELCYAGVHPICSSETRSHDTGLVILVQ